MWSYRWRSKSNNRLDDRHAIDHEIVLGSAGAPASPEICLKTSSGSAEWCGGEWRLIAVVNLVFLTLGLFYLVETKTVYKASARLLVIQQGERPINVGGGPIRLAICHRNRIPYRPTCWSSAAPMIVGRALELAQLESPVRRLGHQ